MVAIHQQELLLPLLWEPHTPSSCSETREMHTKYQTGIFQE